MKLNTDYNIILINLDGLRRDKVSLCPTLQNLSKTSYYFSNLNTVAPYTFASLHAIFSGMYPSRNGVNGYYNIFKFKKNEITTLTELLHDNEYFTSCDIIDDSVIPSQGFDDFNVFDEESVNFNERHSEIISKLSKQKKFFLFLHFTETHKHLVRSVVKKYDQKNNSDDYFSSQKENDERYNSYLPSTDEYVKTIIQTLKNSNIYEKTLLILFSDHGTSIGEKPGEKFYGVFTYDYTLNVFCIIHNPELPEQNISKQCRTIDIFPTIVELLNLNPTIDGIQGESLLSLLDTSSSDRDVFAETGGLYGPWPSPKKHNVFCVKSNHKKLIYNDVPASWEFYNLDEDPCELKNIYDENSDDVIGLKNKMIDYFNENNIQINNSIT